jgi:hypothetical protein
MSNPGTNPAGGRERIKTGIFSADALGAVLVIRLAMRSIVPRRGWNTSLFYVTVYEPAILSIIHAISFLWKRFSTSVSVIVAVLIIVLIVSPWVANTKMMLNAQNRATSNLMFYPCSAFSGEIHFTTGMEMFISLNAWETLKVSVYCKSLDGVVDLFNIYFDASSTRSNIAIPSDPAAIGADVTRTSYTYILMSKTDWQSIPDATRSALEQRYNLLEENKGLLVFLQAK